MVGAYQTPVLVVALALAALALLAALATLLRRRPVRRTT